MEDAISRNAEGIKVSAGLFITVVGLVGEGFYAL